MVLLIMYDSCGYNLSLFIINLLARVYDIAIDDFVT